jgi:hypothetical protein
MQKYNHSLILDNLIIVTQEIYVFVIIVIYMIFCFHLGNFIY